VSTSILNGQSDVFSVDASGTPWHKPILGGGGTWESPVEGLTHKQEAELKAAPIEIAKRLRELRGENELQTNENQNT
jgi:hypothetical protein